MKKIWNKIYVYLIAFVLFLIISLIYLSPVIEGKMIQQLDVTKARGMQQELKEYYEQTGETSLWTNSMFGGMPAYQIVVLGAAKYNIYEHMANVLRLNLPRNSMDVLFIYMIGFFVLLVAIGINPWLSVIGALAFAFSSYNIIIIMAGHVNKALAIGLMPPVLAGIILTYKGRFLTGFVLTTLALGINIYLNHLQMTYYLLIMVLVYVIVQLIYDIQKKQVATFITASLILAGAAVLAVLPNTRHLWTTYEYSQETMRGGSDLVEDRQATGLERSYALQWSYGVSETFTLLIPNFHGGASAEPLSDNSRSYNALIRNGVPEGQARQFIERVPTYWGDQPFTAGPTYFGAIIVFLFFVGVILVKGTVKWWLVGVSVLTIMLSWGSNFEWFTNLFFDYFPLYNKFRAVASILVATSIAFPLLGFLAIRDLMDPTINKSEKQQALNYALYFTGGLCLLFALFSGMFFKFISPADAQMISAGYPEWLINAIRSDRESMLQADAVRSLVFILLAFALLWAVIREKMKFAYFVALFGLVVLIDMWAVARRYLNNDHFAPARTIVQFQPTQADLQIMKDQDPHFRVFNLTQGPFQETYTSYFHKSIGGYHGAKLSRYQDLIDRHLSRQNMDALNMLNTKYFIVPGQNNQPEARINNQALGNAWFVNDVQIVETPQEEIEALNDFDPSQTAIVDRRFVDLFNDVQFDLGAEGMGEISLTEYRPDRLTYHISTDRNRLAVFSEIYYNDNKGWHAYINGERVPHFRVNYVLRALAIPAGEHTLEFRFEPRSYYAGQTISLISSILAFLVIVGLVVWQYKKDNRKHQ